MTQRRYGNLHSSSGSSGMRAAIGANAPLLTFLVAATVLMFLAYMRFNPVPGDAAVVSAAIGQMDGLNAPIQKLVAARPVRQRLSPSPGPIRVGVISGHMGSDPGTVCVDGLTEADVNKRVAEQVVAALQARGIRTELLAEFDARLQGFSGTALVSIHADSCDYYNELATGFKLVGSHSTDSSALSICMEMNYSKATKLPFHANTITPHMTDYHAFRLIAPGTPAVILETGFLNLDRQMLTADSSLVVQGIVDGILCYMDSLPS